jgi:hypothetical protein
MSPEIAVCLLLGPQVGECVLAIDAVLKEHCLDTGGVEGKHLVHLRRFTPPTHVCDLHAHRDTGASLDELGGLEPPPALVVLLEEVDHLRAVSSGRCDPVNAAAGDTEPLRLLCEQVAKAAYVAAVQYGERLSEAIGTVAHPPVTRTLLARHPRPRRRSPAARVFANLPRRAGVDRRQCVQDTLRQVSRRRRRLAGDVASRPLVVDERRSPRRGRAGA